MDTFTAAATAEARLRADPSHRVRVTLRLREWPEGEAFLTRAPNYECAVTPRDESSASYGPANWESGVLSGAEYAYRRWLRLGNRRGLWLAELRGQLGERGIEGIAAATSAALAELLGVEPWHRDLREWDVELSPVAAATDAGIGRRDS